MLEDLKERLEAIRFDRKTHGIKQLWCDTVTLDKAKRAQEVLADNGKKVTIPELIRIALEDFMSANQILTQEEVDDIVKEIDDEDKKEFEKLQKDVERAR